MDSTTARYEFDEDTGQWAASLLEIPQVGASGRSIDQARERLRDALTSWLGNQESSRVVTFVDEVVDSPEVRALVDRAREIRLRFRGSEKRVTDALTDAAEALVQRGYTMRGAAEKLAVSYPRLEQLLRQGSRRLPIVVAARLLKTTPAEYRAVASSLTNLDVSRVPNYRSVPTEIHDRVAAVFALRRAEAT